MIDLPFSCPTCGKRFLNLLGQRRHKCSVLSLRQQQVVNKIAVGKSNKIIAFELGISEGTVKVHVRQAMKKAGVRNRVQLATNNPQEKAMDDNFCPTTMQVQLLGKGDVVLMSVSKVPDMNINFVVSATAFLRVVRDLKELAHAKYPDSPLNVLVEKGTDPVAGDSAPAIQAGLDAP